MHILIFQKLRCHFIDTTFSFSKLLLPKQCSLTTTSLVRKLNVSTIDLSLLINKELDNSNNNYKCKATQVDLKTTCIAFFEW